MIRCSRETFEATSEIPFGFLQAINGRVSTGTINVHSPWYFLLHQPHRSDFRGSASCLNNYLGKLSVVSRVMSVADRFPQNGEHPAVPLLKRGYPRTSARRRLLVRLSVGAIGGPLPEPEQCRIPQHQLLPRHRRILTFDCIRRAV